MISINIAIHNQNLDWKQIAKQQTATIIANGHVHSKWLNHKTIDEYIFGSLKISLYIHLWRKKKTEFFFSSELIVRRSHINVFNKSIIFCVCTFVGYSLFNLAWFLRNKKKTQWLVQLCFTIVISWFEHVLLLLSSIQSTDFYLFLA